MSLQFQIPSRNSFHSLIKPDITKVELLKDVQNKRDLIVRLIAHDIDQEESENQVEESLTSDEDETVLQEVLKEDFSEGLLEDQLRGDMKPTASSEALPKPPMNKSSVKRFLSGKSHPLKSSVSTKSTEASLSQSTEPEEIKIRFFPGNNVATSKSTTDTHSSFWGNKTQFSVSGKCDHQ